MGSITAGGILQGPVDYLLHCTDSKRPEGADRDLESGRSSQ